MHAQVNQHFCRCVMLKILDIGSVACSLALSVNTKAAAAAATSTKSTKCYKSASDRPWSCQNMQWKTTQNIFFGHSTKPKIPCSFVRFLRWEKRKKQRNRLYTMIDGEKVLFALWIFSIFHGTCMFVYMWIRMHKILFYSIQSPAAATAAIRTQYNCIFIWPVVVVVFVFVVFFRKSQMPSTKKHDECSTSSFITFEADIYEKSKKEEAKKNN